MNTKNIVLIILVVIVIGLIGFIIFGLPAQNTVINTPPTPTETGTTTQNETGTTSTDVRGDKTVLGTSAGGLEVAAYHFGTGKTELLFIGGIHGGYSWNTTLVAYELIDYLKANPGLVPPSVTVTVIPVANPDGLQEAVGTIEKFDAKTALSLTEQVRIDGRFNQNNVDLNRNFDCEWAASGTWRNRTVSGGDAPFSEPEAAGIRDYVLKYRPASVVVWFSAEGAVYPSACGGNPSTDSVTLATTFGKAAGYKVSNEFDAYAITGDMVNWLAKENIPAVSVLLTDHKNVEWEKNKAGFEAVLKKYAD